MEIAGGVGLWAVLLVALAGGLGWGIRGCYGGASGPTLPGALIALTICLLSGRADWQQASLFIAAVTAAGLGSGGYMSHVKLAHFSRSADHLNAAYGLASQFFVTGAWGGIGGGALGLALGGWSPWEMIILAAGMMISRHIAYYLLIDLIGIRLTPPRGEGWARTFGAFLCMAVVCIIRHEHAGLIGLTYGYMGWGFGFTVGMFIQLLEIRAFGHNTFGWWRVFEITIGLAGGASLAIGLLPLARTLPALPTLPAPWLALGAYFTLWFIVLLHLRLQFRHYKRCGLLLEGRWARRSASWLADMTSVALAVVLGIVFAAWHFWGPTDPRVAVQASLLGLAGMCVLLVSLLDLGESLGPTLGSPAAADYLRERAAARKRINLPRAGWYVPPLPPAHRGDYRAAAGVRAAAGARDRGGGLLEVRPAAGGGAGDRAIQDHLVAVGGQGPRPSAPQVRPRRRQRRLGHRPHSSLGEAPPARCFTPSRRPAPTQLAQLLRVEVQRKAVAQPPLRQRLWGASAPWPPKPWRRGLGCEWAAMGAPSRGGRDDPARSARPRAHYGRPC